LLVACGNGLPLLSTTDAAPGDAAGDVAVDVPLENETGASDATSDVHDAMVAVDASNPESAPPSNPPPQGGCAHSLCVTGTYLDEGCDPTDECTYLICDQNFLGDDYCCTQMWDSMCVSEVATTCPPYSCN
jgi:hypothetical protein